MMVQSWPRFLYTREADNLDAGKTFTFCDSSGNADYHSPSQFFFLLHSFVHLVASLTLPTGSVFLLLLFKIFFFLPVTDTFTKRRRNNRHSTLNAKRCIKPSECVRHILHVYCEKKKLKRRLSSVFAFYVNGTIYADVTRYHYNYKE